MANTAPSRSKSAPWRWAAAIVVSLCANGLVLGSFWQLRLAPAYDRAPASIVQLIPRLPLPPRLRPETPSRPPGRSARLAARPPPAGTANPSAPLPVMPAPPPVAPPAGPDIAGLSRALRGRLGCDLAHLTDAERAACAERWAANRPATPTPLNLDPHLRYTSNPEPYLVRMPKNGCKVRAAGSATIFGKEGVAAGVTCAWSF